ncbi:MAG: zf-HC2 domain-containing protein, partial [Oscillospiraceae bacterium]|nr:zf-HC2 domain-containing protein [Oscillospiraceae bacterium]
MTNLPCEVVRDLLPSYVDGLTSETTGKLVEAHVEGCDACRAALQAMRAPEAEPENQENEVKEIDFLKKNKKRNRKVLLGSLAGAAALVCLVLFVRFIVIGQELYGMQMLSEVDVQEERLTMELNSMNEALAVSEAKLEESNGVVTLHAKGVYRSFLHRGSYPVIYTASEP